MRTLYMYRLGAYSAADGGAEHQCVAVPGRAAALRAVARPRRADPRATRAGGRGPRERGAPRARPLPTRALRPRGRGAAAVHSARARVARRHTARVDPLPRREPREHSCRRYHVLYALRTR